MANSSQKTVLLGAEHDDAMRSALRDVLVRLGGKVLSGDWGVGGSQELETLQIQVGGDTVVVEAETFVGLSVRGPEDLVERIQELLGVAKASGEL
jgi:hypothetical protein